MVRRFPLPIWAGRFSDVNSLLISALCHLTVLVAMAMVMTAGVTHSPDVSLAMDATDVSDLPSHDDAALADAVKVEPPENSGALGPDRIFDYAALAASDLGPVEALTESYDSEGGTLGTALTGFGDSGGGADKAGKASTDFFGISGYGQKFVYVVDCSGSMRENGKFERAVYELLHSIEQLQSDQEYFVIFYNHNTYPMDEPGLVRATPEQVEKTRRWVVHARPQGGTVPQPALLQALSMKPDAIFFLSDGLFDPGTSRKIGLHNRATAKRIPIHTIAFVNRDAEPLMKTIARRSGGKYRYVP
jgi:hypothetical protein